jgi:hypothetical protein
MKRSATDRKISGDKFSLGMARLAQYPPITANNKRARMILLSGEKVSLRILI